MMPISMRKKNKATKIVLSILGPSQNSPKKRKKTKKEAVLGFEENRKI
jgi:hypothetical protein